MKDFFDRQDEIRRRSVLLGALFSMSVVIIIMFFYSIVSALYLWYMSRALPWHQELYAFWSPWRFVAVAGVTLLVVLAGTLYKVHDLASGGGRRIAELLGGRLVLHSTTDPDERKLINVVEEMAIASGVPAPEVYILDRETGINAMAAGYGFDDAVVCVTRGAIFHLNRDELQGMAAHEFSHIFNGDIHINIRLMGWLHGVMLFTLMGRAVIGSFTLSALERARDDSAPLFWHPAWMVIWLPLYIVGYIGYFFGTLIKVALSRQREYLADAAAVQYTRNPMGLARSLKKIGGLPSGSELTHPQAAVASHMYFSDGLRAGLSNIMKTHPPLADRIEKLDPFFDGTFQKIKPLTAYNPAYPNPSAPLPPKLSDGTVAGAAAMAILESTGAPAQEHMAHARELMDALPGPVHEATREPWSACALIYALLLGPDEKFREKRLAIVQERETPEVFEETKRLAGLVAPLPSRVHLPLVDLSMHALRQLSEAQYRTFRENIWQLIKADHKLSLFEYSLKHVLVHRLDAHFSKTKSKTTQIYSFTGVRNHCALVLSVFARLNRRTGDRAAEAFERGVKVLNKPQLKLQLLDAGDCSSGALDKALAGLVVSSPLIKRTVLAACLECMMFDQTIAVYEAELYRAVTSALGVPAPPWLTADTSDEMQEAPAA